MYLQVKYKGHHVSKSTDSSGIKEVAKINCMSVMDTRMYNLL